MKLNRVYLSLEQLTEFPTPDILEIKYDNHLLIRSLHR